MTYHAESIPEPDDGAQLYDAMLEQERMQIEALERCLRAGARPEDVRLLADSLGIKPHADRGLPL